MNRNFLNFRSNFSQILFLCLMSCLVLSIQESVGADGVCPDISGKYEGNGLFERPEVLITQKLRGELRSFEIVTTYSRRPRVVNTLVIESEVDERKILEESDGKQHYFCTDGKLYRTATARGVIASKYGGYPELYSQVESSKVKDLLNKRPTGRNNGFRIFEDKASPDETLPFLNNLAYLRVVTVQLVKENGAVHLIVIKSTLDFADPTQADLIHFEDPVGFKYPLYNKP